MAAAGRCVGRRLRLAVLQAAGDRRREYSVEPHSRRQSVVATRVWREVLEKGLLDGVSSEADAYHGAAVGEAQGPGALPISSQVTRWMGADAEPRCAIEASICALRQLVVRPQQGGNGQGKDDPSSCEFAGAEWWVQRRPVSRSLDMHFDADSCLMHRNGRLRCPEVSSILYLTSSGGPTVILDQFVANGILWGHRLLPGEATRVDLVFPTPNQFAAFPGLFLHGVMPDLGGATTSAKDGAQDVRTTLLVNWWWGNKPEGPCCSPLSDEMAALLRCSSETSSGGDGPAVEDQPLECDLQKWRNGVTSVEGDVSVMGRTMNYDYFIPDDCKEYPWVERRNVTVTELGHIRRIRTAFGA